MNNDYRNTANLINVFFSNINSDKKDGYSVLKSWRTVVSRIHGDGEKLADHSRVVDLNNGILLVEADHPGWIQLLQFNKNFILKGLKNSFPDLEIKTLAFKLTGTSFEKQETEITRQDMIEEMNKRNFEILANNAEKDENTKEQKPVEIKDEKLKAMLDSLKKSIQKGQSD